MGDGSGSKKRREDFGSVAFEYPVRIPVISMDLAYAFELTKIDPINPCSVPQTACSFAF